MTRIPTAPETDPTAANRTVPHEPRTGRTPTAWTADRGDGAQSETFRALAWSQDEDSVAEPLPYFGEEFDESTVPAAQRPAEPRRGRSTLVFGIAAGFAAVAVGGLMVTLLNTGSVPTTTAPVVIQPAEKAVSAVSTQSVRVTAPVPAPTAVPARAVPAAAVTAPPIAVNAPAASVAAVRPDAAKPAAPEVSAPEVSVPEVSVPEVSPPEVTPQAQPPVAQPPVALPPVVTPPIVSLPEVTPQQVPHPVGPIVLHVPVAPEGPMIPMPHPGGVLPPVIQVPAAPVVSDPGITLHPAVTVPPIIPTFSLQANAGAN